MEKLSAFLEEHEQAVGTCTDSVHVNSRCCCVGVCSSLKVSRWFGCCWISFIFRTSASHGCSATVTPLTPPGSSFRVSLLPAAALQLLWTVCRIICTDVLLHQDGFTFQFPELLR